MLIQTKLSVAIGIAMGIAAVAAVVLFAALQRVHTNIARIQHTDRIVRSVFELKIVTVDHQAMASKRTLDQWEAKYTSLHKDLNMLRTSSMEQRFMIERMLRNHASLRSAFDALRAVSAPPDSTSAQASRATMRRLTAKIDVCLLSMIADANQLLEIIYRDFIAKQRYATTIVGASTLTMAVLILALAVMIRHTAIRPLLSLGRSAAIVGTGDLAHRTAMDTADEVGDLSRAFDKMLDRLNSVMASRDALDREVVQREEAEARLRKTLTNLERSNRDLEQFAYSASHDLQEPLRKVMAFSSLLTREYGEHLQGDATLYMQSMQNATRRMQTLINDLLTYSRVATRGKEFVATDLGEVVRGVLSDLETLIQDTGGIVDLAVLPTIDADPTQMRQLFQNLIGNALKFHGDGQTPRVKVYAAEAATGHTPAPVVQCTVEDDGIGFDTKFTERIFGVFQRLHGRNQYSGSGIGLAVCRRIAERHGGTIQAESTPGQGSKFIVTLPRKQSHEQEEDEP